MANIGPLTGDISSILAGMPVYKPIAYVNRSAAVPTNQPLIPGVPALGTTQAPAQQSFQDWLQSQVDRIVQSQVDAVNAQKQAYLDQLQQQSDLEQQRGQALAAALQGLNIPGRVQQIYGDASSNIGGLAQAFSGALRDQATADAAQQTRMVSGTGQEGAVANNGAGMGDVLYGAKGYIPARSMGETGAAFASEAAMEPGFAQQIGALKAADLYNQGLAGLKQFTDQILQIQAQRPQIESDLTKQYNDMVMAQAPQPEAIHLSNGQVQWFDKRTGQPISNPFGPKKKSSASSNVKTVKLSDGTYQAVVNGKPVGSPFGPPKSQAAGTATLKTVNQGNRVSLVDAYTGKVIKTFTKAASPSSGSKASQTRQFTYKGIRYTTDLQGNIINQTPLKGSTATTKRVDEGGRLMGRTDGVTPTQARKYKATAYQAAKAWHDQGERDSNGQHYTWKQFLGLLVNSNGVPYDLAVRQLGRFSPDARKALKTGINALTGQSTKNPPQSTTQGAANRVEATGNGYNPQTHTVQLPASFEGTHVTDGLGWGTKTAHDFMAPAGTPVSAPVSGTILYFHPDGAQGGGSMLIQGDDGYEYWLGHIQDGLPGGRIEAGQQIARVAFQNVSAPHVHIDRRPFGGRS